MLQQKGRRTPDLKTLVRWSDPRQVVNYNPARPTSVNDLTKYQI